MSEHWFDLADEDAERLARLLERVDPTPDELYENARATFTERWAHELRQGGGIPVTASLPVQDAGGEAAAEHPAAALPGHQADREGERDGQSRPVPADGASCGVAPSATQTAHGRRGSGAGVEAAEAVGRGPGVEPGSSVTASARLKLAARYLAVVAALALTAWLAWFLGQLAGALWLVFRT